MKTQGATLIDFESVIPAGESKNYEIIADQLVEILVIQAMTMRSWKWGAIISGSPTGSRGLSIIDNAEIPQGSLATMDLKGVTDYGVTYAGTFGPSIFCDTMTSEGNVLKFTLKNADPENPQTVAMILSWLVFGN